MQMLTKRAVASFALAFSMGLGVPSAHALVTLSNGIYEVHIDDDGSSAPGGTGLGSWNAVTAAGHPTGPNNDILYSETRVDTNFSSLRIYEGAGVGTYTAGGHAGGINWNRYLTLAGPSTTYVPAGQGYRMEWNIPNTGVAFSQELAITGTTFANSAIYHTVTVTNGSLDGIAIGWRNLYDWTLSDPAFDDGPSNAIEIGGVPVVPSTVTEFNYTPAAGSYARVAAVPPPGGGPTYEPLLALGLDPGFIAALPVTLPALYSYASWPASKDTAFDYATSGLDVGTPGVGMIDDSAGLSWFGRTADTAVRIGPGETVRFTQIVLAVPPGGGPPGGNVPEPGTFALLALALGALGARRLR